MTMLLLDVTHTSHTQAQTGIQRVVRALAGALAADGDTQPVCYDHFMKAWRQLDAVEVECLRERVRAGSSRGARWSWTQRIRGHSRRLAGTASSLPFADGLICPELFAPRVAAALPEISAKIRGPRIAVFHDAIGLKFPELTPPATVARLPSYLRELAMFDGVAAVSEDSAASLREFWAWAGLEEPPPVRAIALGLDPLPSEIAPEPSSVPRVLCVSTIEGRKNHVALLAAAESLWAEGLVFELELVGLPRPDTGGAALAEIQRLRSRGRPVVLRGTVGDAELQAAYARANFTVYPSLTEGFGMPVLESLQHGKPCICSDKGALGESTRGGGCLPIASVDASPLASAMRRLLTRPDEVATLAAEARARNFRTWHAYARELREWMTSLPVRGGATCPEGSAPKPVKIE